MTLIVTEPQTVINRCIDGFLESSEPSIKIKLVVDHIINDINATLEARERIGFTTSFERRYSIEKESRGFQNFLSTTLDINNLTLAFWTRNNLHKNASDRPCSFSDFKKLCYISANERIHNLVAEHFSNNPNITVASRTKLTGYFSRFNKRMLVIVPLFAVPFIGWIIISGIGFHTGKLKSKFRVTPKEMARPI